MAEINGSGCAGDWLFGSIECLLRQDALLTDSFDFEELAIDLVPVRPHSSLQDRTPAAVGAMWVDSREPRESTAANEDRIELEIAGRFVTISPS